MVEIKRSAFGTEPPVRLCYTLCNRLVFYTDVVLL